MHSSKLKPSNSDFTVPMKISGSKITSYTVVAATASGSKVVYVYDSAYSSLDQSSSKLITGFFVAVPVTLR